MDDDLLLNFTTAAPKKLSEKQLATLQGKKGNWRDRKRTHAGEVPAFAKPKPAESRHQSSKPRTSKPVAAPVGGVSKLNSSKIDPKQGIVSSLFSYNPEIRQKRNVEEAKESDMNSTNAPLANSSEFMVHPRLKEFLADKMHFTSPTQIQSTAIPALTEAQRTEKDVVLVAQTGSGKTLAYLLPVFSYLMSLPQRIDRQSGIFAVVLAPTRELATQIFQVCEEICRCCHYIVPGLVIGGEKKKSEKARLRKGVNILIGTPGRMADHVDNTSRLTFSKTKIVVLDEGDRLIDMGFEETVTQILSKIPESRTTVLCSATMNTQASRLKTLALSEPVLWVREQKKLSDENGDSGIENTPGQLLQRVSIIPAKLRLVALAAKLNSIRSRSKRAVVFFSCTDSVDFHFHVFDKFQNHPAKVFRLHGSMTQQQRTETLNEFLKSNNGGVLLTTDVASRGLDATVDEVVEYDPPATIEDHLHRAGRTARAGRKGEALMFLLPSEQNYEQKLKEAHSNAIKQESYQSILQRGFGFGEWMDKATSWQLKVEKAVVNSSDDLDDLAKRAFTAHVRAYTTHLSSERDIFSLKQLHLGHLAKAFALRETPSGFSSSSSSENHKKKKLSPRQAMLEAAQKQLEVGEYNVM